MTIIWSKAPAAVRIADRDVDPLDHGVWCHAGLIGFPSTICRADAGAAFVFAWHKTWGALILLLALVRLAVRLMNPPPPYPSDYPKWERFVAVWNHRLFYILLIALPLTGLAAVSGRAEDGRCRLQLGLTLPAIPGIAAENDFGDVHEVLVWTTLALVVPARLARRSTTSSSSRTNVADRMWPFKATPRG